jgi:hypothetical protein
MHQQRIRKPHKSLQLLERSVFHHLSHSLFPLDLPLKYHHSSIDLLSSLFLNTTLVDLIFLGDSVSTQLCQYLICDLIRLGLPLSTQQSQVQSFHHTITEFSFSFSFFDQYLLRPNQHSLPPSLLSSFYQRKNILRIHNKQFNLPCMNLTHPDCHHLLPAVTSSEQSRNRGIQLVSNYLKKMIQTFTNISYLDHQSSSLSSSSSSFSFPSSSREIILILNYGLHLKKAHRSWAIPGMVKGILEEAKRFMKPKSSTLSFQPLQVRLLWRETSAQAFGYSKGPLTLSPSLLSLSHLN